MRTVRCYNLINGGRQLVFTAPTGLKVNEIILVQYKNTTTQCKVTAISNGQAWAAPTLIGKILS